MQSLHPAGPSLDNADFSTEEASIATPSSLVKGSMSKPAKGNAAKKSRLQRLNPFSKETHPEGEGAKHGDEKNEEGTAKN